MPRENELATDWAMFSFIALRAKNSALVVRKVVVEENFLEGISIR